ncbi:MAG: hypothetical protein AAGF12_27115 [Myxococcota bacterium]
MTSAHLGVLIFASLTPSAQAQAGETTEEPCAEAPCSASSLTVEEFDALMEAAGFSLPPEPGLTGADAALEELRRFLRDTAEAARYRHAYPDPFYSQLAGAIQTETRPNMRAFHRQRTAGMDELQRAYHLLRRYASPEVAGIVPRGSSSCAIRVVVECAATSGEA